MEERYIKLDGNAEYVIYGAGSGGAKIAKKVLEEHGKVVKAFIDKRAAEIKNVEGIPVFTLADYSNYCKRKENTVIVITLKNPFLHSEIASSLLKEGFRGLIYQPISVLHDCAKEEDNRIAQLHNAFLMELRFPENQLLPKTTEVQTVIFEDRFLISHKNQEILCYVPIELIFNQTIRLAYADVSMPAMFPYVDFYKTLLDGASEEERILAEDQFLAYSCEYLKRQHMLLTQEKRRQLLSTRIDIFKQMERNVDLDHTFFERTAPIVKLEKGVHFNLISSGKNKISYQIAKGKKQIPVIMSEADYEKWTNSDVLRRLIEYLSKNGDIKLFAPIPHPRLADIQTIVPNYSILVLGVIGRIIMKQIYSASMMNYQGMNVVDGCALQEERNRYSVACYMKDDGALYRYLCEFGIKVYRCTEPTELEALIDELLLLQKENYDNGVVSFKTAIMDGRLEKDKAIELGKRVDSRIYLFEWESGAIISKEFLELGFYIKRTLFSVVWDEKVVKLLELEKREQFSHDYYY